MESKPHRKPVIAGIIILLMLLIIAEVILALMYTHSGKSIAAFENSILVSRLSFWLVLLIMYVYVTKIEKQPLLLYKAEKRNIGFYVLSALAVFVLAFVTVFILSVLVKLSAFKPVPSEKYKLVIKILNGNTLLLIFTALTAGVVEELLFRGYLLSRLQLFFKNSYMPVIISSVIFGLFHIGYGTVLNVVGPILLGVLFALYYNRYKKIVPVIIAHALYDFVLILISMHTLYPHK